MDSAFSDTPMITDNEIIMILANLFPGSRRPNIIEATRNEIPMQDINGCGIETVLNGELSLLQKERDWPLIVPRARTKLETDIHRHQMAVELENMRRENLVYIQQIDKMVPFMGNSSNRQPEYQENVGVSEFEVFSNFCVFAARTERD